MSGGHFNLSCSRINDLSDEIEELIDNNNMMDEYGYSRNYEHSTLNKMKEFQESLRKIINNLRLLDYLVCGDIDEKDLEEDWIDI